MKLKKFAIIMMTVLLCVTIVGCKSCKKTGDETKTESYTITYNLDGGTNPADAVTSFKKGTAVTLPTPTKSGYSFSGWYDSGNVKWAKIPESYSGNLVLTARWKELKSSYTITYALDGGTLPTNAPTEFDAAGLATLPTPTKAEFTFAGWYDEDNALVTAIAANTTHNVTLTAKWVAEGDQHNIVYHLDGGTLPTDAPTTYLSSTGLATLPTPTKEGFTFAGWKDKEVEGNTVDKISIGKTGDIELYAAWSTVKTYTITYNCEDGILPEVYPTTYTSAEGCVLPIPTPKNAGESFLGWYDAGGNKYDRIPSGTFGDKVFTANFDVPKVYQPRWTLNASTGWTGNGMNFGIKVLPVNEFDPFDADYTGSSRDIKQSHQRKVEAAYGVTIVWSAWDDAAPWGPERVKFINNKFLTKELQNNDMYVVNIASQWIPTLVKAGSVAELYSITNDSGIFNELSYEVDPITGDPISDDGQEGYRQTSAHNEATSIRGKVYGYAPGKARPDYFMYYNVQLVNQCNLEDPAQLWLKGEWTLSRFDQWVKEAQNALEEGSFALDMGFAEATIGLTASTGNRMTSVTPPRVYMTNQSVTGIFELIQGYYSGKYYYGRGVQDVSPGFAGGKSLLHHGDIWFLKNSTRFDPGTMEFTIGCVPYPTDDGYGGIPVTTTDVKKAIDLGSGQYLQDSAGNYITSVDMSESTFKIPFTGTSCYSMLNVTGGKNGINYTIATHILHDLISGLGDDPNKVANLTEDESYRNFLKTKFDRDIDVEVVMSCQGTTYFELMEMVSMTVGGGSHFGPDAYWPLAASICKGTDSPRTQLNEVVNKYKAAMREMGYNVPE